MDILDFINLIRKVIHIFTDLSIYILTYLFVKWKIFVLFPWLCFSLLEVFRLHRKVKLPLEGLWGKLLSELERRSPSDAWYYLTGVFSISVFSEVRFFRFLILVLALADPLAFIVGFYGGSSRRWVIFNLKSILKFHLSPLSVLVLYLLSSRGAS
ncbi:MAG: Phosphatidate cytidylyltransferase [bacterium 42_11]|nr:MAG: Phosphatidate cytidylyltransferase [bacterium 42_11]